MMVFAQLTVAIYILADHPKCWGQGATKVSNDLEREVGDCTGQTWQGWWLIGFNSICRFLAWERGQNILEVAVIWRRGQNIRFYRCCVHFAAHHEHCHGHDHKPHLWIWYVTSSNQKMNESTTERQRQDNPIIIWMLLWNTTAPRPIATL